MLLETEGRLKRVNRSSPLFSETNTRLSFGAVLSRPAGQFRVTHPKMTRNVFRPRHRLHSSSELESCGDRIAVISRDREVTRWFGVCDGIVHERTQGTNTNSQKAANIARGLSNGCDACTLSGRSSLNSLSLSVNSRLFNA